MCVCVCFSLLGIWQATCSRGVFRTGSRAKTLNGMGFDPKLYFKFVLTCTYKKRFALTCESGETYSLFMGFLGVSCRSLSFSFGWVVADHKQAHDLGEITNFASSFDLHVSPCGSNKKFMNKFTFQYYVGCLISMFWLEKLGGKPKLMLD